MRVNIYAEEMTERIEIIEKRTADGTFTGVRFYLELPVSNGDGITVKGPFVHKPGDDDSAAVTFWGKRDLEKVLERALSLLRGHHKPAPMMGADHRSDAAEAIATDRALGRTNLIHLSEEELSLVSQFRHHGSVR